MIVPEVLASKVNDASNQAMPLKRMREELDMIRAELEQPTPDLQFLLVHAKSFLQHAEAAAEGVIYPDTTPEDVAMIKAFKSH